MGRLPCDRAPRRRRDRHRQPQRQAADPLLPRARRGPQGAAAAALCGGRRDRHRPRGPPRLRPAHRAHPPGRLPGEPAGRADPGQLRRLRPAGPRGRLAARRPAERAPGGPGRGPGGRHGAGAPGARHHGRRRGPGVVRAVRGRRARRGGGQAARSALPPGRPADVQDQARAHGRRGGGGLPLPQERPDRRLAPARPVRRLRRPPARRRLRGLPDEAAGRARRGAGAAPDGRPGGRRAPLGGLAGRGRPRGRPAAGRAEPLDRQEGPVVGGAAAGAGVRGGLRPHGGRPLPAHRPVPPLAPDRSPDSCTYTQLEEPVRYDLAQVLSGG